MEDKHNESTSQRPEGDRMIDAALVHIDLPLFMEKIKEETSWKDSRRNAITVFKTNGLRIVLIALHQDSEMARHIADGIISVQVLKGHIQFMTDQKTVELSEGQMLALHERIPHSVKALQESIFLLTLATSLVNKQNHL
jgi:quercetin dioxygenase-like cupin family protein